MAKHAKQAYRPKHSKMRFLTKLGLIRVMRANGSNITYLALFS